MPKRASSNKKSVLISPLLLFPKSKKRNTCPRRSRQLRVPVNTVFPPILSNYFIKGNKERAKRIDAKAPKRPQSAFFRFMSERRAALIAEQPALNLITVVRTLAGEWKEMTDKDKFPYIRLATQDKENYDKALLDYKNKNK